MKIIACTTCTLVDVVKLDIRDFITKLMTSRDSARNRIDGVLYMHYMARMLMLNTTCASLALKKHMFEPLQTCSTAASILTVQTHGVISFQSHNLSHVAGAQS